MTGAKGAPSDNDAFRRASRRQENNCCGVSPRRRATSETTAPRARDSSTACAFSSSDQRRRRSPPPVITSIRRTASRLGSSVGSSLDTSLISFRRSDSSLSARKERCGQNIAYFQILSGHRQFRCRARLCAGGRRAVREVKRERLGAAQRGESGRRPLLRVRAQQQQHYAGRAALRLCDAERAILRRFPAVHASIVRNADPLSSLMGRIVQLSSGESSCCSPIFMASGAISGDRASRRSSKGVCRSLDHLYQDSLIRTDAPIPAFRWT